MVSWWFGIALLAASPGLPAPASTLSSDQQGAASLQEGSVLSVVKTLKPGEFLWVPEVAPEGPMLMIVNRSTQRAVLYRNAVPIAVTTVSTGRAGYRTPTGAFAILEKDREHFSNLYDDAPMPFMQRLTWGGIALHAGHLPGEAASHGCIRLPPKFAALLFAATRIGMIVVVTDQTLLPAIAPVSGPSLPLAGSFGGAGATPAFWSPDLAPSGPVTLVVSTVDQQLVVLRNARMIGRMPIKVAATVSRPFLYRLTSNDAAGKRWDRVPLQGQNDTAGEWTPEQFAMHEEDRARLESILHTGTTVVISPDSLADAPASYLELLPRP